MPRQPTNSKRITKDNREGDISPSTKKRRSKKKATKTAETPNTGSKVTVRQQHVAALYEFTNYFFDIFSCEVRKVDRKKYGPLTVSLASELVEYFETDQLYLTFHQAEPVQGQLLVAHGSPIFDKMISYLDRKSAVALQQLPVRYGAGEELLQAIQPTNAGIVNLRTQQETQLLYAFHWRITYRADDKREELYTVLLDDEGQRIPNPPEAVGQSAGHADAPKSLALETLLGDAEPVAPVADENGELSPPKLPPMTQLVRLAENARKYAVYHADVRCVSHEADILPRLYKTLNRLSTYYQQQIEEVYDSHDPDGEKRRALEVDLERKLAEEVENHRLRVQLQLVSYVVLQVPVATVQMTLSDGSQEVAVTVTRDRYSGELARPRCTVCNQEIHKLAVDRNGHVICDNCIRQCGGCQDILCADCGVQPCPVCAKENCDTCGHLCWACGERACSEHIATCPICGDEVCFACQSVCVDCGVRQCRSHLRLDHVRQQRGEDALVCNSCAIRCPGCQQYSALTDSCESSGQQFCEACLVHCVTCNKRVGPGFFERFDGQPYCHSCLVECPSCANWTLTTEPCPTCGNGYCAQCSAACAQCGVVHCADHSHHMPYCDHTLCSTHLASCTSCHTNLCPICSQSCAICGGYHCDEHVKHCRRCTQRYCLACINEEGYCTTCANIDPERDVLDLSKEPCAAEPQVQPLIDQYNWAYGKNERYKIYLGQDSMGQQAMIVVAYEESATGQSAERLVTIKAKHVKGKKGAKSKSQNDSSAPTAPKGKELEEKDPEQWMHEFQDWLRRMRRRRGR